MYFKMFLLFIIFLLSSSQTCTAYLQDLDDLETFENFDIEMADSAANNLNSRPSKVNKELASLVNGLDRFNYDDGAQYEDLDFVRPTRAEKKEKNEQFMRFGRNKESFMRFGRGFLTANKHMKPPMSYFGKNEEINKRRKRDLYNNKNDKRAEGSNFMRFGRNPNFMRFGRNMKNILKNLLSRARFSNFHSNHNN